MARDLSDLMRARSRQLAEDHPWIWLYEVEVPTVPPTRYRLTNYDRRVTFDADQTGVPLEYQPLPIVHGDVVESGEGDLPTFQVQVSNDGLILRSIMEEYDGLVGQPVVLRLVHSLQLANAAAQLRFDGQIVSAKSTYDRVAWNISALSITQAVLPGRRYVRAHCRFRYGGPECGYDLTNQSLATGFPSCTKTLAACRDRGALELTVLGERKHPLRFGGWPGIPRGSRA